MYRWLAENSSLTELRYVTSGFVVLVQRLTWVASAQHWLELWDGPRGLHGAGRGPCGEHDVAHPSVRVLWSRRSMSRRVHTIRLWDCGVAGSGATALCRGLSKNVTLAELEYVVPWLGSQWGTQSMRAALTCRQFEIQQHR